MGRSQSAPDIGMEDLLASIRRAIREEDQASVRSVSESPARPHWQDPRLPGTATPVPSPADDIKLLRDKINMELARAEPRKPSPDAPLVAEKPFTSLFRPPQPVVQPAPSRPASTRHAAPEVAPEPVRLRPRLPEVSEYAPVAPSVPSAREPGLLSPRAAESTAAAFGRLSDSLNSADHGIEQMTREMLQPMLKHWLDTHLPAIVERLVREEIERVARRGR